MRLQAGFAGLDGLVFAGRCRHWNWLGSILGGCWFGGSGNVLLELGVEFLALHAKNFGERFAFVRVFSLAELGT